MYGVSPNAESIAKYRELGVARVVFRLRPEGAEQVLLKLDKLAQLL